MGKSVNRVKRAAADLGLQIEVITLPESTRTAQQAADAVGCAVGQIAKSMIFEGAESGALKLVLVSGAHDLDLSRATEIFGEPLVRADPARVRRESGFAIGGVSPIGHLCEMPTWIDAALMTHDRVWAAGGAPETVFEIAPDTLRAACGAVIFSQGGG
ncbi:YbaK/EbsC family protein [Sulfitobacter albidus]|uniref:YbaK/EbsC family protein n=1 Tax=Sulfitobacter albidus TaxID=2829501 RepID=A0A975JB34_9RHOB|nr:YbaK/EbsC family protein [Sulfitobacter albidus]QUJ75204.1 YbaK/EbsC family protein [Sulfitobacter albidus]